MNSTMFRPNNFDFGVLKIGFVSFGPMICWSLKVSLIDTLCNNRCCICRASTFHGKSVDS